MGKYFVFVAIGVILVALGVGNCKGNLSTIHWYHRRKVIPADLPKYGRCIGFGTIICGASLLATAALELLLNEPKVEAIILAGFAVGLVFMLYGQVKYNKGLF